MRAFIKFNKGMMRLPIQWRLWLLLLVTANLVIPLFHLHRLEAQVVIGTLLISMMIMTGLTALTGFTHLLDLGHILWVPLLYWLWTRLSQIPLDDMFGMWIRALMVLNALSLVIDVIDVARFVKGEREEVIKGLA